MLCPLYIEAFFKPKLRVPNDKRGSMVWVMIVILKLNSDSCPVKMIHFQCSGVSKQMTEDRKQKSEKVLHLPVFIICHLSSDI
jgi:hypothetical protein